MVRTAEYRVLTDAARRFGYPDEKVARLTREAIAQGFNHFKVRPTVPVPLADIDPHPGLFFFYR